MGKAAVIVCPVEACNQTFKQEPKFYEHLKNSHSVPDAEEYYVQLYYGGKKPVCACKTSDCGAPLDWHGWKKGFPSNFIRGHNVNVPDAPIRSREVYEKARASRLGQVPWNKDRTKDSDERVARAAQNISKGLQRAYDEGRAIPWQLGLTKENNPSLQRSSETKKEKFASGELISWNEGYTKDTHPSLAKQSETLSQTFQASHPCRFTEEEFQEIMSSQSVFTLLSSYEDYKNRDDKLKFACRACGDVQLKDLKQLRKCPVCFSCHPKGSLWQVEVYDFVKKFCTDVVSSDRSVISPLEIDIYVPSQKFGIECNGLFYHCELNENFDKHHIDQKTDRALAAGVKLFHVFEDEWKNNRSLVESMILHRLGLDSRKVDARKCEIVSLETKPRRAFFAVNHLDGDVRATASWGLLDDTEIVAALSVRVPDRKVYPNHLEIARFATAKGTNVRGALGKLMKHAEEYARANGYDSMMTYVDGRLGEGKGYESVDFKRVARSAPRFWWTDRKDRRFPREFVQSTRKIDGKSQKENADERGVCRIYGCKNYVLKKKL